MQNRPLLTLGPYTFEIATAAYSTLLRQARERWARLNPVGGPTVLQHLGPGAHQIELEGVVYPHWRGGLRQIDQMRELMATGEPQIMVTGEGDVMGYWAIEAVEEEQGDLQNGGAPLRQRFRMSLHYYGDRPPPPR